jgi:thymidylate synthase (FAD)
VKNKTIFLYDDEIGSVQYVDHLGDDKTVVNSARVSFGVEKKELDEKDKKLIKYLVEHKHTSTLEHCVLTFKFVVPLFVRSQHHRHRTWSYNEISRRYTDVNIQLYEPKEFRTQHKSNRQASNENDLINPGVNGAGFMHSRTAAERVRFHHQASLKLYHALMEQGVCREQARGVLPQNMYTEYYGTANLNNLFKFIDLRTHEGAQWEIQKVAEACLEIAKELYPSTVQAYEDHKR